MAKEAVSIWLEDLVESGEAIPMEREPSRTAIVTVSAPQAGAAQHG